MSDLMLTAVLSMPYEMAMEHEMSRRQFWDRAQQALAEIERLREQLSTAMMDGHDLAKYEYRHEIERLTAERDELRRQLAEAEQEARRYRWLRPRFFAADFAYSDPPVCAIVFRWPESAKISANLDREIDAAMGGNDV